VKAPPTIRLGEFCELFEVTYRDVRYILEQGHVPAGVDRAPLTGNHREFAPGQAFWLAIVVKLKASGLKTPLAAKVADYALNLLRGVTQQLNWDFRFHPQQGWFDTEYQYHVEVGDLQWIRFVTDANPSHEGELLPSAWLPVAGRKKPPADLRPYVILRLDLTVIAATLKQFSAWADLGPPS
jgi:hypothetical protein